MRIRHCCTWVHAVFCVAAGMLNVVAAQAAAEPVAEQVAPADVPESRLDRLNTAFLEHVRTLGPEQARAAEAVQGAWESYRRSMPQSFVPDALALLYADYRDALNAFDEQRYADLQRLAESLRGSRDPFLAANARYLYTRALIEQGLLEEAEEELRSTTAADQELEKYTPYAAHLRFIHAYCEASNLHFEQAQQTLKALQVDWPDAPELVQAGVRQLLLEIERRERGTLDEVAGLMGYSAARLKVADATERVRSRQDEVVALLDKLMQEAQEREQQQGGSAQQRPAQDKRPRSAAQDSALPESGTATIGELHRAPEADPGEMWGQLPPAERERILDSLRDRFPSRYRQLVEQYYRSLAEEK